MKLIKIYRSDLNFKKKTPILDYCRWLISIGESKNSSLHVYAEGRSEPDIIVKKIGEGAKLTVKENNKIGPVFAKYKPMPENLKEKQCSIRFRIAEFTTGGVPFIRYFTYPATTLQGHY